MVEHLLSPDLPALRRSWEITLVAANKSPTTVTSYVRGVNLYLRWREESGHPVETTRARVRRYGAELNATRGEIAVAHYGGRPTPMRLTIPLQVPDVVYM